jgi:hypothetical protein
MILVDPDSVATSVPPDWSRRAAALTEALSAAPDALARKKLISDNADLWRELKPVLRRLVHGKCWYCEAREDRSDNAVDHFDPRVESQGVQVTRAIGGLRSMQRTIGTRARSATAGASMLNPVPLEGRRIGSLCWTSRHAR